MAATNTDSDVAENNPSSLSASLTPTRQSRRRVDHDKNAFWFVCNTKGENDDAPCNNCGFDRCSQNTAKDMMINAQKIHILDENSDPYPTANITSGKSHDINAADVYDHKSCYSQFIYLALEKILRKISMRQRANWGELCATVIKTCMPEKAYVADSIDIIMDTRITRTELKKRLRGEEVLQPGRLS